MSEFASDKASAREDLFRFLSACFYEPAPEFAEEKLFDSIRLAANTVHPDLAEPARRLGEAFVAQDLQSLLVDYTRLFLGPIEALASPYGASWLNLPTVTDDNPPPAVLALYSAGGFEIDPEFRELPDHVAVELEFLYLLTFNSNRAQAADKADELADLDLLRSRFLGEHLGVWIGPFAAAIKQGAATVFYRELAEFTERFLQFESVSVDLCQSRLNASVARIKPN
ncbi:MAG: molecular chaperone TorD family protein [Rhodoferax sp.]|uniref:TorD/DmsD family molecular chaperone n=1 Tax=Rhodoferax sp. TaxID=50421 RepID=UPI002735C9A9|nr:molecular chaperone TorD family protein [Rhodoferax sp.]MDP2680924.1 molecular chaperone TorD family protein [Rhodoferax sp.]